MYMLYIGLHVPYITCCPHDNHAADRPLSIKNHATTEKNFETVYYIPSSETDTTTKYTCRQSVQRR